MGERDPPTPVCLPASTPDVMGYHDAREIPNYLKYAAGFTLDDHMFEPGAAQALDGGPRQPVPSPRPTG